MYFYLSILASIVCLIELGMIIWLLKKKPKPAPDQTASELLSELLDKKCAVVSLVLDPNSFVLLSPKDRR